VSTNYEREARAYELAHVRAVEAFATCERLVAIRRAGIAMVEAAARTRHPATTAYETAYNAARDAHEAACTAHEAACTAQAYAFVAYCHASPTLYALAIASGSYETACERVARIEARTA